ncbi:MAG: hypothetical protein ACLQOO_13095 [Terriglobia bacterium]
MATIQLTDDFGLDANVKLAPFSSLLKYFQQLPALRLNNGDFSKAGGLTLDQPALTALNSGLSFDKDVSVGPGGSAISVSAGAHGLLELIQRTPAVVSLPDLYSSDIAIAEGTCYIVFGVQASVGIAVAPEAGLLQFGVGPGENVDIRNYQSFPLNQGMTLLDAVEETVGNFIIPASADDLTSLPDGCVATVTGTGSLKLSGTANLLAVTNPLASVALPASLPVLSVTAGGVVQVGASLELRCTFQICAQKVAPGHVRLGWYRQRASDFAVNATVSEGLSAGFGSTDLFSTIIGVVSANGAADLDELQKAGLLPAQIKAIQDAVEAAVSRKLELALSTEIGATESSSTMFLYDIDAAALAPESRQALDQALGGDLSGLHGGSLPGVTTVQSVWAKARTNSIRLEVNLLGILNFGSISTLTSSGAVLFEPATGALVITDKATAQRIRSTAVNFGADTQKLRHVMAESFLLTAAYQGLQQQIGGPALTCSHDFFDLENDTSREQMARELRVGAALGLFSGEDAAPPDGIDDFGRTVIHASTDYDSGLAATLFLDPSGAPIPQEFYENAGRAAIQLLVSEGDADAVRRQPAIDDGLWSRMKAQGQPGFVMLFPDTPAPLLGAITADYSAIMWWAVAMAGAGQRLAAIRKWFDQHPATALDEPEFQSLRQDLAAHLKEVASTTSEQFGEPWGLIAMDEASGRRGVANILITGPKLVLTKQRALSATARL